MVVPVSSPSRWCELGGVRPPLADWRSGGRVTLGYRPHHGWATSVAGQVEWAGVGVCRSWDAECVFAAWGGDGIDGCGWWLRFGQGICQEDGEKLLHDVAQLIGLGMEWLLRHVHSLRKGVSMILLRPG